MMLDTRGNKGQQGRGDMSEMREQNQEKKAIQSYKDLRVFQLAYDLAMEVFWSTKEFPKEETYFLTDQVRRSSRSICANVVEGWAKRIYESVFKRHLIDSIGSCDETKLWLQFSLDCQYINSEKYDHLVQGYNQIGKMLKALHDTWRTFK
jgi:four helix bundle protein